MKWIRLWTDEVLKGTTFTELTLSERGLWWSLLLLAGDSMTPGIVELRKGVKYPQETLAIMVNCDRKTLRKGIEKLISVGKISHTNDGRIIITNWRKYQTRYEKYYKNKGNEKENNNQNNVENNGIDMQGREEGDKKKKRNIKEKAVNIIQYLNETYSRNFKVTSGSLKHITARLNEGFTEEDLKQVIDTKWNDQTFDKKYFRPATLFNSEKFEGYLNEKPKQSYT